MTNLIFPLIRGKIGLVLTKGHELCLQLLINIDKVTYWCELKVDSRFDHTAMNR